MFCEYQAIIILEGRVKRDRLSDNDLKTNDKREGETNEQNV